MPSEAIFVLLGKARPYALNNIDAAVKSGAFDRVTVITDNSRLPSQTTFSTVKRGDLVSATEREDLTRRLSGLGVNTRWRGGYWVSVLERFALLAAYSRSLAGNTSVVHLENDVASFVSAETLASLSRLRTTSVHIPFIDGTEACPGFMYCATPEAFAWACDQVVDAVARGGERSDMTALAGLEGCGGVSRLPTGSPAVQAEPDLVVETHLGEARVAFDALAVGMYLFGMDPRNTQGVRIPGYRYKPYEFDVAQLTHWQLVPCSDDVVRVGALTDQGPIVFASLHVHGKVAIPHHASVDWWKPVLDAANGLERPRIEFRWGTVGYQLAFDRLSPIKQRVMALRDRRGR